MVKKKKNNNKKNPKHCKTWKIRMHTVGREIWREALQKVENEKFTLYYLFNGRKLCKTLKIKNTHIDYETQTLSDL
jgi:hypothetical protein